MSARIVRLARHRGFVVVALLAAVLATALLLTRPAKRAETDATAVASSEPFAAARWPAGTTRTYRTTFHSDTRIGLRNTESGSLGGHVDLEGDLALVSHGVKNGGPLTLSITWTALRRSDVEALERSLAKGGATVATAVVEVEPDGHLVSLGFSPDTAPLARMVQRSVVTELLAVVESALGVRPEVRAAIGRVAVERANGIFTRARYVELDAIGAPASVDAESHGKVTLDASGVVATAEHVEHVSADADDEQPVSDVEAATRVELALLRTERDAPAEAPAVELVATTSSSEKQRASSLARRSEGVTLDTVQEDLRLASLFPKQGETAWMWRDSAWLELHPDASAGILGRAESDLGTFGLAAATDLVVVSGTTAGQTALLGMLERVVKKDDGVFEMAVQHVEHLRAPRPEIFALVARAYSEAGAWDASSPRKIACAYALGALARRSLEQRAKSARAPKGDRPACTTDCAADETVTRFERELASAPTDRAREVLLRALGNAGQSASFSRVAPHRRSPNVDVRRAAAAAMRNMEGSIVVDALLALAADGDSGVASEAFDSLFRKQLEDADFGAIEQLVRDGRVPEEARAALIDGIVVQRETHPVATGILVVLLGSDTTSSRDKMKIENILRRG